MNKDYPDIPMPYLGSYGRNLTSVAFASGNFCLKLPDGFARNPMVANISEWNNGFCFSGRSEVEWVYVEHLRMATGHESDNIENWVEVGTALLGKPHLHSPDYLASHDSEVLSFEKVPAISRMFMQRHSADDMITYIGTIRYKKVVCRLFILCLRRGNESWMVEYVFPAYISKNRTDGGRIIINELRHPDREENVSLKASLGEMQLAGVVLGNFRAYDARQCFLCTKIVSDDESLEVKMDDVKVFDDMPLRGSANITVPCCSKCLAQIDANGVDLECLKSNEVVSKTLQDGGRFNEEWMQMHAGSKL